MKRRFNETIDGSIKNIIQLKTVNNSLEWSQMYDALEDCPVEFINKLIQTLNSLGETMGVEPTQTFDKVLCNADDDNEETRKKLYNWWRGVFEVLGSCKNSIPKDREAEFNEKVDALMAEILKSGDGQNTAEEEPEEDEEGAEGQVMLEEEYEPADKEDETNMLADMKWAVGKIGEIANRVQELINFVNPYCEVNESLMDSAEHATSDELGLMNGFEKEDKSKMKKKTIWKEIRQTSQDDWVDAGEVFEMAKDRLDESDLENELDEGDDGWVEIGQPVGESRPVELESGATKKVSLYVDWDDDGAELDSNVVIDVPAEIADSEESTALYDYITDWIDHQDFCVNDWAITDIEGLTEISENNDEVKSADVKDGEKQVTQDGETKTLVAGEENKKPVCEMTIEQEIDDPWKLSELLWSQGKENLEELLRSELVGEEEIMQMLEDMGVRNLTNINDLFAFDFPSVLDSLGLDPEAWSQNLEFVKRA